jgi:uncharacterized membrane protein
MLGITGRSLRWILAVSIVFNLCFLAAYALGQARTKLRPMSQKPLTDLPADLQLSPDQRNAYREDCARVFVQVEPLQKEMAVGRQALMDLVMADKPDETAISAQLDAIAGLQRKVQSLVIAHILKEKTSLRPEQRDAFNRMLKQRLCPKAFGERDVLGGPMGNGCPGADKGDMPPKTRPRTIPNP